MAWLYINIAQGIVLINHDVKPFHPIKPLCLFTFFLGVIKYSVVNEPNTPDQGLQAIRSDNQVPYVISAQT